MDEKDVIIAKAKRFKQLVEEIGLQMNIESVWLFGSYAAGTQREHSDIDVAFVVERFNGNFSDVIIPIWKLRRQVDFRIEPHVIARDTDYAGMIEEVQRTGILI